MPMWHCLGHYWLYMGLLHCILFLYPCSTCDLINFTSVWSVFYFIFRVLCVPDIAEFFLYVALEDFIFYMLLGLPSTFFNFFSSCQLLFSIVDFFLNDLVSSGFWLCRSSLISFSDIYLVHNIFAFFPSPSSCWLWQLKVYQIVATTFSAFVCTYFSAVVLCGFCLFMQISLCVSP